MVQPFKNGTLKRVFERIRNLSPHCIHKMVKSNKFSLQMVQTTNQSESVWNSSHCCIKSFLHLSAKISANHRNFCLSLSNRSNEIVQEYDRHLGAVNTITFVDENRRFVSTSDDKSMRIWEWDIPVDMKVRLTSYSSKSKTS